MAKNSPQDLENRRYFSDNMNRIMSEKGVRQIDLHNETGIPKSTITGYVKGNSLPTAGNLQKIADFLGVKKSQLDLRFIDDDLNDFARHEIAKFYKSLLEEGISEILIRFIIAELNTRYFHPEKQYPATIYKNKDEFLNNFSQFSVFVKDKWLKVKRVDYYVMDSLRTRIAEAFQEAQIILKNNIENSDEYLLHGLAKEKLPNLTKELSKLETEVLNKLNRIELEHANARG